MRRARRAALGTAILLAAVPPGASAGDEPPSEVVLLPSGAVLARLTPPSHDAVRPRISPDGRRVAYVRRGAPSGGDGEVSLDSLDDNARGAPAGRGDEIWEVDLSGGAPRRRVAAAPESGLPPGRDGYSLHDLAWSPEGDRLGFTWYDGAGWARLYVSDPGHPLLGLPVPEGRDPWEGGAGFSLSATQMTWSPRGGGRSGHFVAWDDQCGSVRRLRIPEPGGQGSGSTREMPGPGGCLPLLIEAPGFWLYRSREADMAQRVGILDERGSVIESRTFRIEEPVLARWGASSREGRPPAILWWREIGRDHVVMSVWRRGSLEEWAHLPCDGACPEPVLVTRRGLWLLDGPGEGRRLMLLERSGGSPMRIVPSGVTALRSSPDGSILVLVMRESPGGSSLWRLDLQQ